MKALIKWSRLRRRVAMLIRHVYRASELSKLLLRLRGKTLHWALYLVVASLVLGGTLGYYNYRRSYLYVVFLGDTEIGYVRDAMVIEEFVESLAEKCSLLYGMPVAPREEVSLQWKYRPGYDANAGAAKEALRRRLTMVTDAVMVIVEHVPVVPVASNEDVEKLKQLLGSAYVSEADNVLLLQATIAEKIIGEICSVTPEELFSPEEVADLLLAGTIPAGRMLLSRSAGFGDAADNIDQYPAGKDSVIPAIHVITVEQITVRKRIPFTTIYKSTGSLWTTQSRVLSPGRDGSREVVYHVTRENGVELSREKVSETVLVAPVNRVVERGTAAVPAKGSGVFLWPVERGGRLTQGFRGWSHSGIDISHPCFANRFNTRILAADCGVVVKTGSQWPMGNYIVIFHGRYFTVYCHNKTHFVSTGDTVRRGQAIALMGNTGRTRGIDGIHLHFEIRVNDGTGVWNHWRQHQLVDPLIFFR